ncbi:PKD domain-containing protein [Agrococcus sp. HG114]|uniref:PKD domain-containing protein n=1 Tax=Agrococcus sp. HG114 TaxID=2969757 RepID=UPI00215A8E9B|nr:PKD domain-containing protein [Agrococcus sp. HG114]MCR8670842.1 PKD domain-containing protein [Agrococcus sp. HG114]
MDTMRSRRRGRAALLAAVAAVATGSMLGAGLTVASAAEGDLTKPVTLQQRDSSVVTADPLPTVQIDSGYVWAQAMIGTTVYAVGGFSNTRPPLAAPGTNLTPRSNVLAFDITTGGLLPWAPTVNGPVRSVAVSPDGSRVYIGGSFSSVNGQARYNFAVLSASSGALVNDVRPAIGGAGVFGIVATADTVYVTGRFTQANGVARQNLAAFATADGALRSWAPTIDLQGDAIVKEPGSSRIIVGGRFYLTNGVVQRGLAALDPVSGALDTSWLAPKTVINGWNEGTYAGRAGIFALTTDSSGVYGTGWVYANVTVGNLEGVFAAEAGSGAIRWIADCHGDHYGVYSTGRTVYATSHTHQCDTVGLAPELSPRTFRYAEAFTADARGVLTRSPSVGSIYKDWSGTPAPAPYAWYPDFLVGTATEMGEAGLSITGTGQYISIAGEFPAVNNQRYQGLVRFSTAPPGGPKQGPRIASASWGPPTATSVVAGRVRVTIPGNWDRDDRDLTYQLQRSGAGTVASRTLPSSWWSQPQVILDETGLTPGATYSYTVRAVDGNGNAVTSRSVSVTVASGQTSAYVDEVLDDGAGLYYPLGSITKDWAGSSTPLIGSGVSATTPGAVPGLTGESASAFNGTTNGRVSSAASASGPSSYSLELWFSTTTTRGGKLIGFGSAQTGSSSSYDRHIYMQNTGRLTFGVYPGQARTITSPAAYNDGRWHHVVATQGSGGIALYVDGRLVAQDATVTSAQQYSGFWRIGGDNLSGWPSVPSSLYFTGAIDEVAVYGGALSSAQVAAHHTIGTGQTPPTASFTTSVDALRASVDASGSTAASGASIASYSWSWGDGTAAGAGVTATHTYAAAGTYSVTLTVTDSRGVTGSTTQPVTVSAANVAPTAALTTQASGLTVSANGSGSSDPDGTIAAYSWDWGDGSADSTGVSASHTYAAAGSYTVTLTVRDDDGATDTATASVTVTAPPPQEFAASDAFGRTVSPGWGTADAGGAWAVQIGTSTQAAVAGGVGTLTLGAGKTQHMLLGSVALRDARMSVDLRLDQAPSSGSAYAGVLARSSSAGDYRVRTWLRDDGSTWLVVQRGSTVLRSLAVAGLTRAAGDTFTLEVEVTGAATTTISATIWRTGTTRPAGWQITATDTAALTGAGAVGVNANRSASATTTGGFAFDNFRVTSLD